VGRWAGGRGSVGKGTPEFIPAKVLAEINFG